MITIVIIMVGNGLTPSVDRSGRAPRAARGAEPRHPRPAAAESRREWNRKREWEGCGGGGGAESRREWKGEGEQGLSPAANGTGKGEGGEEGEPSPAANGRLVGRRNVQQ